MCFAPQRRALFRHLNVQKWPEHAVIWAFLLKMCFAPQRRALFPHRNDQKSSGADVFCHFLLPNVLRATTACTFSTSQLPKVVREWCVLTLLTSKCASRHNGVHFFHISTSKSAPNLTCFDTFYFQMCLAPQRRALFQHLNFQKASETDVFWHFLLPNVLRATTACTFSSLICPDVSAPAALASLLFDPPEPQNKGKTQCFATSLPFRAPASSLFWLSPSLIFSLLTFYTSEFLPGSASSWLCFSSVHIVGTLVSKLPSINGPFSGNCWGNVLVAWLLACLVWPMRTSEQVASLLTGGPAGEKQWKLEVKMKSIHWMFALWWCGTQSFGQTWSTRLQGTILNWVVEDSRSRCGSNWTQRTHHTTGAPGDSLRVLTNCFPRLVLMARFLQGTGGGLQVGIWMNLDRSMVTCVRWGTRLELGWWLKFVQTGGLRLDAICNAAHGLGAIHSEYTWLWQNLKWA